MEGEERGKKEKEKMTEEREYHWEEGEQEKNKE